MYELFSQSQMILDQCHFFKNFLVRFQIFYNLGIMLGGKIKMIFFLVFECMQVVHVGCLGVEFFFFFVPVLMHEEEIYRIKIPEFF